MCNRHRLDTFIGRGCCIEQRQGGSTGLEPAKLMNRCLLCVCATVLVACGAVGAGAQRPSVSSSRPTVVPWIDVAAGPEPTPTPTPPPAAPPAGVPGCRSSDLRAHTGVAGAGLSHYAVQLVFTDHGGAACVLRGFPRSVRFLDASGNLVTDYPIALDDGGYITTYPNAGVELLPGVQDGGAEDRAVAGQAFLQLQTLDVLCGHATVAAVLVVLSDGGTFRFDTGFGPDLYPDCVSPTQYPPMMSSFQIPGYPAPSVESTPQPDLGVAISVSGAAHLGKTLDYTVTLTNVSGRTLAFDPCPGYTQSIKSVVVARYLLNCSAVPTLNPGESRTFAMELRVGTNGALGAGRYPLDWSIDAPFVGTQNGVDVAVSGG